MARMRTIAETIKYLKKQDPDTAITMHALRRMVLTNEIPTVRIGKKYLINLDSLEKHFTSRQPDSQQAGGSEQGRVQEGRTDIRSLADRL